MFTHVVLGLAGLILPMIAAAPVQSPSNTKVDAKVESPVVPADKSRQAVPSRTPATGVAERGAAEKKTGKRGDSGENPAMNPVPEPLTLAIVGAGLVALAFMLRRRHRIETPAS